MTVAGEPKNPKKFRSIRTTLIVAFSGLSFLILTAAVMLESYLVFINQQEVISSQQAFIANDAAKTVSDFIQDKISILGTAVNLGNLVDGATEERTIVLNKLLGRESSFRQLALMDSQGRELAAVSRTSGLTLNIFDKLAKDDLLKEVSQNKTYIAPIYFDETTGEPLLVVAVPVRDVFGDFKGILLAEVDIKFMWDLVANIKVGSTGLAYVIDKDGLLIAFRDTSRVLRGENLSQLEDVKEFMSSDKLSDMDQVDISKGIQGTYIIATYVPLGMPNWAVVIEMPVLEAYAPLVVQISELPGILVAGLLVAILSGLYISRRITRPILELSRASLEISHGNFDAQAKVEVPNEIGKLAEVFNFMASRMKSYTGELEGAIAQRTEALNKKVVEESKNNQELKRTELAMANLLEDARDLETKLGEEKANVEKKVDERTRELKEEQARLLASINNLTIGFIMADLKDNIILKNSSVGRIFGIKDDDVKIDMLEKMLKGGMDLHEFHDKAVKEKTPAEMKNIPMGNKFLRFIVAPIIMVRDHSEVIGYVLLIEDETEARILERTREDFFAVASHELRTPLTAIRGNASLILEFYAKKIKDKEILSMVDDIHAASIRLIGIVNDFLDASRLEQRRIELKKEQFDVDELLKEQARRLGEIASEKKLYLRYENDKNVPHPVLADKERVKQVIINLIGNAINYTKNGGVDIWAESQNNFIKIYIKDTGVGIEPANQNLLFRKFQQAGVNTLTRDVTKGTGLGLYISKLLVDAMGGEIKLEESALGKGSVFSFTLPAIGAPAALAASRI